MSKEFREFSHGYPFDGFRMFYLALECWNSDFFLASHHVPGPECEMT